MFSKISKKLLTCILLLSVLLSLLPAVSFAAEGSLEGKTLSILGDSASTFDGVSNNPQANSTIDGGVSFYPKTGFDITAENTWWGLTTEALGLELLVNNSWSGSCVLNERYGTPGAYIDRCVQLHNNEGRTPDLIAMFMGANDYYTYGDTIGTYEEIDFSALIAEGKEGYLYATPVTTMEAYAICLHKMQQAYPDAEIYCFTIMPRLNSPAESPEINTAIIRLADHFGVHLVETYYCGINPEREAFYMQMGDVFHPNIPGMQAVAGAFVSSILEHSRYLKPKPLLHKVDFRLEQVISMQGTAWVAVHAQPYAVDLAPYVDEPMTVSVTVGGRDVTDSCYKDGRIYIPSVSADVVITAKARPPKELKFAGASLTVASNLSVNFKLLQSTVEQGGFTDPYVVYEMGELRQEVRELEGNDSVLSFPFRKLLAQWMNDTLTASLYATHNGREYLMDRREYSVATYCYNQLRTLEDPSYSGEYYSKLRTLLVDLLRYGAAMQSFTDYRTHALASERLSEAQLSYGTQTDRVPQSVKNMDYALIPSPTAYIRAVGLELIDSVHLVFVAGLSHEPQNYRAKIQCNGEEWWIDGADFQYMEGFYRILFDGLYTSEMSETVLITLYEGEEAVSNTMSYSIESYVASMIHSGNPLLETLVRYMLRYGDSAKAFTLLAQ